MRTGMRSSAQRDTKKAPCGALNGGKGQSDSGWAYAVEWGEGCGALLPRWMCMYTHARPCVLAYLPVFARSHRLTRRVYGGVGHEVKRKGDLR